MVDDYDWNDYYDTESDGEHDILDEDGDDRCGK